MRQHTLLESRLFPFKTRCLALVGALNFAAFGVLDGALRGFCPAGTWVVEWLYVIEDALDQLAFWTLWQIPLVGTLLRILAAFREAALILAFDLPLLVLSEARFRFPTLTLAATATWVFFWATVAVSMGCELIRPQAAPNVEVRAPHLLVRPALPRRQPQQRRAARGQ